MKEKKLIVIKKISKASEYNESTLVHCSFWAIERDSKTPALLDGENTVAQALKNNCQVLAVSTATILVPLAFEVADRGHGNWRVADIMHVKIDPACEAFRDEFISVFADNDKRDVYYDTDLWRRLNLEAHFKNLINGQKAERLAAHGSGAIDPSQFNVKEEIKPSMPDWCVFNRDEGMVVDSANADYSVTWIKAYAIADKEVRVEQERKESATGIFEEGRKELARTWIKKSMQSLKDHPFKTIGGIVVFLLAVYYIGGCLSSYNEKQANNREQERIKWDAVKPVKGSMTVRADDSSNEAAWNVLRRDAEAFARDVISRKSSGQKAWANGEKIELPANTWAAIVTETQKFATDSKGDYICNVSGRDVVLVANTSRVKSFLLDVTQLNKDIGMVGTVGAAFGVEFNGRDKIGPRPVRAKTVADAAIKFRNGDVRMELIGGDTFVFTPDFSSLVANDPALKGKSYGELKAQAEKFWHEDAAGKFVSLPADADALVARFSALDHEYGDGHAEAIQALDALAQDCARKSAECKTFSGLCNERWRSFFAPADMACKRGNVLNAAGRLDALMVKIDARRSLVSFDEKIAAFKTNEQTWWKGVGATITAYNNQVARKQQIMTLVNEMAGARDRNDFSEINGFSARLANLKAQRMSAAKDEMLAAQNARPTFSEPYVREMFGRNWVKLMKAEYASMSGVQTTAEGMAQAFDEAAIRYFCPEGSRNRTLAKAMENACAYADIVSYNHNAGSVPKDWSKTSGDMASMTEIALLNYADYQYALLLRRQRKAFGK